MTQLPVFVVRALFNCWPPLLFTGIRLVKASKDWRYVRVEMPLRFYNKNSIGIHFGGSLYSMVDPWYMMMVAHNLGRDYFVVDHSASIRYEKPGIDRVYAEFFLSEEDITLIKQLADKDEKVIKTFAVDIKDDRQQVICNIEKTIYIRKKI